MLAVLAGCSEPWGPLTVHSSDPSVKIPAIKIDAADHSRQDVAQMVDDLDSDDAAVRFYAIQGLHRLTGEDLGYRYYDDSDARRPAVKRWRLWLGGQRGDSPAGAAK